MKFIALIPVRHGAERTAAGEPISLTEKEAEALLKSRSIAKPSDPQAAALVAEIKAKADEAASQDKLLQDAREQSDKDAKAARAKAEADAKLDGQKTAASYTDPATTKPPAGQPGGAILPPTMAPGAGAGESGTAAGSSSTTDPTATA